MSIGRTFKEAFQKAARSLEIGRDGLVSLLSRVDYRALALAVRELRTQLPGAGVPHDLFTRTTEGMPAATQEELREAVLEVIATPLADRAWYIADALRLGATVEEIHGRTKIDPWFLVQMREIIDA